MVLGNIRDNYIQGELHGATINFCGKGSKIKVGSDCYGHGLTIDIYSDARVEIGNGFFSKIGKWTFSNNSFCSIGENVSWNMDGHRIHANDNSRIEIANNCSFHNDFFMIYSNDSIKIGSDCLVARNVTFRSNDGHKIIDLNTGERTNLGRREIVLGNHVWIGQDVLVLYNSRIGNDCIVGARSVVKGKFFDNCMIGGYMARVLKENITWEM